MTTTSPGNLTIGRLARAADVGIETIRYYQGRDLLPVPATVGAFRHYPPETVDRVRFIKRAQELGFSLAEIAELLRLGDGADRASIRQLASDRLVQIEAKLADLRRMQRVLKEVLTECEHTRADLPCPIIDTIRARSARRAGSVQEHHTRAD
jgi:MerR family mercuric resistance operon transcriptional regulator